MAQQVVRRSAFIDAATIKIAAISNIPEMRKRDSQRHHMAQVGDALSGAAESVGELDAIGKVIDPKSGVKLCRQQILHEPLREWCGKPYCDCSS